MSPSVISVNQFLTTQQIGKWVIASSLLGKIEIGVHRVLRRKFNSEQFLFEGYFDLIGIFRSIQP